MRKGKSAFTHSHVDAVAAQMASAYPLTVCSFFPKRK